VFLEFFNETLTVRALRTALRETGAIGEKDRPKNIPLIHYLLFKFSVDWHVLVHASQGDNSKEIAEAQRMLDEVQSAFAEADRRASEAAAAVRQASATAAEAKRREDAAKADEEEAVAREAEAREREAPFKAAQEELQAALAEVHAQEAEYHGKIADAERRSEEGGVVSRNKAKAELAQLKSEDPLPLRKAKITLEAATKKAEKARAPFEAATKQAEAARAAATASALEASHARAAAEEAHRAAEAAKHAADEAVEQARQRVAEAEGTYNALLTVADARWLTHSSLSLSLFRSLATAYLHEIKSRPGCAHGSMWWMERELYEAKRYLPESKGGIRKEK